MNQSISDSQADGEQLRALLTRASEGDRSLLNTLGALMEAADDNGTATLHNVAMRFRAAHLATLELEGRDAAHEAGRLTMDQVREHLATSLIPRLVANQSVTVPGLLNASESRVQLAPAIWQLLRQHRADAADLVRRTGEALQAASPTPAFGVPKISAPFGKTLKATGLSKIYRGRKVVDNVALQVQQGEIVGLLGPNGAGKTTTFYMLVGLIEPLEGRIELEGVDITDMPMYKRARRGIGYLSQEPSIFRKLSVEDNILAILEMLPISSKERAERLETLLSELKIKHLRHSKAFQLSGGERRRLEITRALVTRPHFMMLDEPFAGVDPLAVHDIQAIVSELRDRGIGVLISDHNVEQTLDIVDRAYIMFEGRVQVSGTVRELVFDDTVSREYLGPTLTARLRSRFSELEA